MIPDASNWKRTPGGWDPLHATRVFESTDALFGFPSVWCPVPDAWPEEGFCSWPERRKRTAAQGLHFFTDDYRFESVWNNPDRYLDTLRAAPLVLSPDFSIYCDKPIVMQAWQVYRQRWTSRVLQDAGVACVPVVSWGDFRSYGFAFSGIDAGSCIAVTSVGRSKTTREWDAGMRHAIDVIGPEAVVIVGPRVEWCESAARTVYFESDALQNLRRRCTPEEKQLGLPLVA